MMLGDAVYEKMHDEGETFAVQKMQEAVMRGSRSIFWSAGRTLGVAKGHVALILDSRSTHVLMANFRETDY
jgi:hypothetical protein